MKKNLKLLTIVSALIVAVSFTTCKQFREDPEEMLSYWTSEVIPKGFSISGTQTTNSEGILCIPSASDVTLTINLHNPRKFKLVMPTNSADAHNIITFPGFTATSQPAYGSTGDYTLTQTADDKLELTYKSSFLKKHEWSSKNIGPEITFISTDGRKFSKKFSLNLKVDTPPKLSSTVTIGKTASPIGSKYYYVIILKAEDMSETAGTPSGLLHKEIKTLSVTPGAGSNTENISFTPGHTAFAASGRLLAATNVTQITSTDLGGQEPPPWEITLNADPWALRYRTDTEVKTASKAYIFTLIDEKGLKSSPITVSTPVLKAKDVQLFYGTPPASIPAAAAASPPPNPYTINAGSTDTDVTVTAETATPGAKITGKVEKQDDSLWVQVSNIDSGPRKEVDIRLQAPEPNQEVLYKISLTAGGVGFATGTEKIFFVKVTKHTKLTISGSDNDAWKKLKTAVENSSVGAPSVIIIDGTIKAPSGAEQIKVHKRTVTIRGKTGYTHDKLNADNHTFIFDISSTGDLTLEKLILQNGNNTASYVSKSGGAIYCAGGKLKAKNVLIENCKAKHGGGIHAISSAEVTLTGTTIQKCEVEEDGGAIYCKESKLTLNNTTIGGSAPADGNTAKRGGGIYFDFEGGRLDVSAESFISYNKANKATGVTVGGGGVYIQGGEFVLNGEVSNNKALSIANGLLFGGGVYVGPKAKFIMNAGAKISGNKAPAGAGVYISAYEGAGAGSFTMEGGEISGCHAGGPGFTNAQGGGVYIKAHGAQKGSFTMKGGSITGCTAEANTANGAAGGGVYADVETVFKMSGGAVITPSSASNTPKKSFNDVYLADVTYEASIIVTDELTSTSAVARLTMKDLGSTPGVDSGYTVGRVVVKGASVDTPSSYILKPTDAAKFQVTPQRGVTPAQNWKVVHDGSSSGTLQLDP